MELIKDLGIFPEKNYKRYGIFKCLGCGRTFKRRFTPKEKCNSCSNKTHGDRDERLYKIYMNIKQRIFNKNDSNYQRYGAMGISICDEWKNSYEKFKKWAMDNGYSDELSIDRIDNDGNYEPDNCRWATKEVQARNRNKTNRNTSGYIGVTWCNQTSKWKAFITVNGKCKTLKRSKSKIQCAKVRDEYIIDNNLEHMLNFNKNLYLN